MNEINVTFRLDDENTQCPICFSTVTTPLIQCFNAPHFVCLTCFKKCRRKGYCAQCRTTRLFHNKFLERSIKHQMRACINEGCSVFLFPWDEEHENECRYKQSKCQFCDGMISKASIKQHFKEECQIPWIDESDPKNGSSAMTGVCRDGNKGFQIEIESIKKSFVVLRSDQVMTFKRNESNYDVDITHLTNDATRTDITYWLPNPSNFFDTYKTISMKADESNVLKPTIPIEVIDLLLHPRNKHEEREQDGMDRFFQQLLDTRLSDNEDE